MRLLLLILACHCCGCRMPAVPPLRSTFHSIHAEPTILHLNDCSNKSVKYAKRLREAGYNAAVVVIRLPYAVGGFDVHAVVRASKLGQQTVYLDPSFGTMTTNLTEWGSPLYEVDVTNDPAVEARMRGLEPTEFQEYVAPVRR